MLMAHPYFRVSTVATEATTQKVRIYRDDDVHIELDGVSITTDPEAEPIDPTPPQWTVRPFGVCYLDSNSVAARVVIKPSQAKLGGQTLTALSQNGSWFVNYRCQLAVEDGELDVLRLRIPGNCPGPFDVQSAVPVSTELKSIDEQNAVLSVRYLATVTKGTLIDLRFARRSKRRLELRLPFRRSFPNHWPRPSLRRCTRLGRFAADGLDGNRRPAGKSAAKAARWIRRTFAASHVGNHQRFLPNRLSTTSDPDSLATNSAG